MYRGEDESGGQQMKCKNGQIQTPRPELTHNCGSNKEEEDTSL
jgi:hypothetical protein